MKQEEKELLFKDICARLPYGVKVRYATTTVDGIEVVNVATLNMISTYFGEIIMSCHEGNEVRDIKMDGNVFKNIMTLLRPISSITEEEVMEWAKMKYGEDSEEVRNFVSWKIRRYDTSCTVDITFFVETEYGQQRYSTIFCIDSYSCESIKFFDWLNAHHFDYRGLIRKGLALPADNIIYSNINKNNE